MKPYTHLKNRPLIYAIINNINSKLYVGKTKCIYNRCYQYIYDFKNRSLGHINDYLYHSMNKYGIENFDMVPLEFCKLNKLAERELYWIKHFKSNDKKYGYNLRLDSSTGMITSPETSAKIRKNLKEQWINGKRKLHGEKVKANWNENPNRKAGMSTYFTKILTKYRYIVEFNGQTEICTFKRLKELNLDSVLSNFHRNKTNVSTIKGYKVIREKI